MSKLGKREVVRHKLNEARFEAEMETALLNSMNQQDKPVNSVDREKAKKLYAWYQKVDMQWVTHIGGDEATYCWEKLQSANLEDVVSNNELFNLLAALNNQYSSGFTGRAKRKRKS